MPVLEKLNIGIVGAAGRGASFRAAFDANPAARIHAVCDVRQDTLDQVAEKLGASEKYADYGEMLDRSDLDAVVIGTPMQFHAPQAILALKRGIHALSEVTAGVSISECRDLVTAQKASKAVYMMAENYTYTKPNVLVRELVRRGLFGEVYYAEGEYLHELKGLNEITKWRRRWQTGIDGITYGTHSLGPILQWMPGDRAVRVCCEGSGHHYADPRGDRYENQDTCVMLAKTSKGGLIKVRVFSDDRDSRAAMLATLADELGAAPIQHIGKLLVLWRPVPPKERIERDDRGAGPKVVKVLKFSKSGNHRAQVRKVTVLGNMRLTAGGELKRAKKRLNSTKKAAQRT